MRVWRGDLRDVYAEDGRSVVMVDETVVVLSELATAILDAVPEHGKAEIEQITAAVVEIFGDPEPPDTALGLTLAHVHELMGHRVLVSDDETSPVVTTSTPAAVAALRSALRHIRSDDTSRWRLRPPVTAEEFVAATHQHQVVSLLDRHRGRLALPPGAAAALNATSMQRAAAVEILATELSTALDALDRAGVRALALKGLALARQAHGDIAARGAGDLDLLVAPADVERAHAALTAASWSPDPVFPQPGPSWAWRHMRRTGYEVTLFGQASAIDLHWHLSPSPGTFPSFETLWERRSLVRVRDRDVPTLAPYDALAHSAGHAAKDEWAWMRSLVDVHLLLTDPEVWRGADRPLRGDQLITVGLAVRMFGMPEGAPPVLGDAISRVPDTAWSEVLARQAVTPSGHRSSPVLGHRLRMSLRALRRTDAGLRDSARQLAFSLVPPWLAVTEPSRHAVVAVPRVLFKRARGASARLKA